MKKFYILVLAFLAISTTTKAQKISGIVRGIVQDSLSAQPLGDATVSVMALKDSSLVSFTTTSSTGRFEIKNLAAGEYQLLVSFTGLQTMKKKFAVSAENTVAEMGTLDMRRSSKMLDEVVITDDAPIKVKGDTLAFNANAFKTKPNATVEDLLKKLPGVQVEKDGTVKAQGENVQKVYVDGKEFFSNDPKLATKNLTADMVDQVEVFDDMSEQAKFNKIDDGSRSKAINLKLKKDKKKGTFGKVYAGYGTDNRYDAGATANFFKGATQTSLIAKTNNTNNIGFTVSDMLGMSGGGGMSGFGGGGMQMSGGGGRGGMQMVSAGPMGGGGGFGGFSSGSGNNGITSSSQIGINYRDTWSKKIDGNGSYFFNRSATDNLSMRFRQDVTSSSILARDTRVLSSRANNNHRFNYNLVWNVDSMNSIIYNPNINWQQSKNYQDDTTALFSIKDGLNNRLNETRTINDNTGNGINWNNNITWRKKFSKLGRTLSVNLNNTYGRNDRDGLTDLTYHKSTGDSLASQKFTQDNKTDNYGASVSFTEPLARDKILELNYGYNRNQNETDRETMRLNNTSGKYDILDSLQTNHFINKNESNRFGTNFRYVKKKYNVQVGIQFQNTTLLSNNLTTGNTIRQSFTNVFPNASFNYQFARSKSLRMNYRGRTNQPSATQLQPVVDVTNATSSYQGNPNLNQEFSNNVSLSYSFFDMIKFRNLFAFVNFSNTSNRIVNSIEYFRNGTQITRPVNTNGVYSVNGNFNIGFPIKKMKGGNFNTNTRINYSNDANFIKESTQAVFGKNKIKNLTIGEDLRLSYNYKDKLDMGINAGITFTSSRYSIQKQLDQSYFTHLYSADVTYTLPKGFILSTDVDYTAYTGRSDGFNQSFIMWNAGIAKQLFKNKRGEVKLAIFDILKQNQSITRNVTENYIEDVQNSVLQRFGMLTFTYNINRMGGRALPSHIERATRGVRFN